jgi:hypothetical protein
VQRLFPALLLTVCSTVAFASTKVSLVFPDNSDKLVFESSSWPVKDPAKSTKLAGAKVEYTIESSVKTDKVFVVDMTSGKVASKPIGDIKDGTWTVSAADFTAVYKVRVEVSTPKGPVSAATVDLESGSDKRNELIDPAANGAATFFFVKNGEVRIAVNYKAGGQSKDPVKQVFTVSPTNSTLKVALPDGESSAPTAVASGTNSEPAKTGNVSDAANKEHVPDPGSPIGNFIVTLIGLALVVGVGYFIVQYMKKNPDQMKDTLTKLGADIPKPGDQQDAVHDSNPIVPIAPQPMQQIILGGPPPSVAPTTSVPIQQISQSAPVSGIPKLVASDGSAFELPEGETTVGREFGAGLVVPNDTVSRNHASLIKSGSSVELRDNLSTNGSWINGAKVNGSQQLRPGDSVRFGSIEYRYEG